MTWTELPPGLILIAGGLLAAVLPWRLRQLLMLGLPVVGFLQLLAVPEGSYWTTEFFGAELVGSRVDGLSLIWGYIFYIAAFIGAVFHLHVNDRMQDVAAMTYAGSAIGAVFAGDLLTLFVYWELTAVTSAFLVFASRTDESYRAGIRYLLVQILSGVLLLGGIALHWRATGSVAFESMTLSGAGPLLMFLGIGVKCAFPLLHNWLPDAYPRATPTGTVFLSAFTTKMAVYTLARGFPGTEELIWIGAAMAVFPLFFATIENDLRRVMAYSLQVQLGFMVVGVGIGTELALDGAAAHAFTGVIYKGLLFMVLGAVLYRTGSAKASDLGGLARAMPWTMALCLIGAASISAFPLFAGFISKSLILSSAGKEGYSLVWTLLLLASVGVFYNTGIRIPFAAFFAAPKVQRGPVAEAPANMVIAMAGAAVLCIAIGVAPEQLYRHLPFQSDYQPYTAAHVVTQLQLLAFTGLGFAWLLHAGLQPETRRGTVVEFDWFYRRGLQDVWRKVIEWAGETSAALKGGMLDWVGAVIATTRRLADPQGLLARTVTPGTSVLWLTAMLGLYLLVYYA
ncbi:MAG: Na(+)/H(+) antiporter subunit D [Minwuia sp.]|uniref:Na(+)/H(+) antiporter subunit D n=1 Tax=Minwuia sp. TaxID=2493630 RepID=UPI003A83A176